jgi:cold shock CspA family protein
MSSLKDAVTHSADSEKLLGRVKWFNNKAGYGFVTVTDGSHSGTDVFVHHSAINVENQQYKYLVQGEYVEFVLIRVESDKHEWQASQVSGIRGGKLMCETRHDLKVARNEYKSTKTSDTTLDSSEPKMPRQKAIDTSESTQRKNSAPRVRGEGPRVRGEGPRDGDKKEWTLVGGKGKENSRPRKSPAVVRSNQGSTIITIQSK